MFERKLVTCMDLENVEFQNEVYFKLSEAETENKSFDKKYTHDEVFGDLKSDLAQKIDIIPMI